MAKKQKGERFDAYRVWDVQPIQQFMTDLLGERVANEAVCKFDIDMEALDAYIEKKNAEKPGCVSIQLYLEAEFLAEICR